MQNWEYKKLGEIYNFIDYRGMTPNKIDEGIPLITAKNVRMGYIDYSIKDFISEEDYKKRQTRGVAHKGDILFTTEAPLGYSALADLEVFSTGQRIITFQQFDNEQSLYNPFYNYYFQSSEFQKLIKENATGLTATGIKASRLREIPIPLPPLEEQKRIVKILDEKFAQLETVKANAKANLQNAKDLLFAELTKTFEQESWETMSLQDVCTSKITDGTHQTPKYCTQEEGGYPFISSKDVTKEYIDWTNIKYIVPELHEELYKRIAPQKDDVLLAKNGTTGVAAIVEDDKVFDIYVTLAVLRPNKEIVNPRYLLAIVNSPLCKEQFNAHLKGSGVPNLHLEEIQKVIIPVPPLNEQESVVKKIENLKLKVHEIEEIYTKQLANCDELKQAFLAKSFAGEL